MLLVGWAFIGRKCGNNEGTRRAAACRPCPSTCAQHVQGH